MDTKDKLYDALNGIIFDDKIVLVNQIKHIENEDTYITYYVLLNHSEMSADDEEEQGIIYFTVDIFTNNAEFDSLVKTVKKRLRNAGFCVLSSGAETYDKEKNSFHIPIDCVIENLEEE